MGTLNSKEARIQYMKIKRSVLIGSIVVAISILVATIYLSHIHNQKEQIDIYLTPLIKEATLLSSSIRDVTDKKSIDVEIELDMAKKQFASFKILVHGQERIRVMVEANQNGEPLTPDEVSFLNTLNDSVCALVDALKNDNGILRVTSARQYSNVITAFVDAIRESEN